VKDIQPLLTALADPTRRNLYERLNSRGPASASQLAGELPISRQAIAKHLLLLDSAGLVDRTTSGREVVYSARIDSLSELRSWLERVGSEWDSRLEKLRESFQ
jgi:predicted ArsR family transcriptional regulator